MDFSMGKFDSPPFFSRVPKTTRHERLCLAAVFFVPGGILRAVAGGKLRLCGLKALSIPPPGTPKTEGDKMEDRLKDKYKGMLWGLVVGDCLGSPIQFSDKHAHRNITRMEEAIHVYREMDHLPKGCWTDDSSMAFCIMESFIRRKYFDLNDVANNFIRWREDGFLSSAEKAFDIGGATDCAIDKMIHDGSLKNGDENSQGNGSLIRYAPAFILERQGKGRQICRRVNDLTHDSEFVRTQMERLRVAIDAALKDDRSKVTTPCTDREDVPNSGWSKDTVDAAFWAFCTSDNFREGMLAAVNLGGDSDSIGAVYGQLAGAYYGYEAIPQEWIRAVKDYRRVDGLIDDFLDALEKKEINTLSELWDFRCRLCSGPDLRFKAKNAPKLMNIIRRCVTLSPGLEFVEHISKPEEFSTQILCKLLNDIKSFQLQFLQKTGLFQEYKTEDFEPLTVKAEYQPPNSTEKYDISFWSGDKGADLVCIVEVKITAGFQPGQMKRYYDHLSQSNSKAKALVTLTKFCVRSDEQVVNVKIKEASKKTGVKIQTLSWCDIIDLLEKYNEDPFVRQALKLFKSDSFLLQESGCACDMHEKSVPAAVFFDKIKKLSAGCSIHQGSSLKHRHIVLLAPGSEKTTDWCGGLMALNIYLDCYSVLGRDVQDDDCPEPLREKACPFFDVVFRCYEQIEDHGIKETDDDMVKKLQDAGYREYCVFTDKYQRTVKHRYLCKSLAERFRISDEKTLEQQIENPRSEFWKIMEEEISAWKTIVCGNANRDHK